MVDAIRPTTRNTHPPAAHPGVHGDIEGLHTPPPSMPRFDDSNAPLHGPNALLYHRHP